MDEISIQEQPFVPPTWPVIDEEAQEAVCQVLKSGRINYWTGIQTRTFENEFAAYVGMPYALAVANGTLALELALRACEIGPGDEVVVPSRTFIATAGCVAAVGATPVVADIDPATNNLTALTVAEVLTPRTKAIIAVHLGGYPVQMDEILSLARQVGAYVIEDCAQAHGATYKGRAVGSLADIGCFSFCQDKIMPLGEGGMITFKDKEKYESAWSYRDHGRSFEKAHAASVGETSAEFKWLTDSFGSNARMGEMEGALGRVMLKNLEAFHEARTLNAVQLAQRFDSIEGIEPLLPSESDVCAGTNHAFYRLYTRVNPALLRPEWSRNRIITELVSRGVPVQYGSCALIAHEKAFESFADAQISQWRGACVAHRESMAFLVHPTLQHQDIETIGKCVEEVMKKAVSTQAHQALEHSFE